MSQKARNKVEDNLAFEKEDGDQQDVTIESSESTESVKDLG